MKNKKTLQNPIKLIGALVFLMAFMLNIQTSLNGEWELVNAGIAQSTSGGSGGSSGGSGGSSGGSGGSSGGSGGGGGGGTSGGPTCGAGGCGATSCSFSGEIVILGSGSMYSNSVSCASTYYACCYTTAYCFSRTQCS